MPQQDFRDWESSPQIDPLILRLLQKKQEDHPAARQSREYKPRRLSLMYATYLGVGAMVLVILLGVFRGIETDEILVHGVRTLLLFCGIGFITGKIAEQCVHESAKSMLYEMLRRADQIQTNSVSDTPINAAANEPES